MPVLPDVASTIVVRPGSMRPSFSAASIIATPIRSFTEPPGLKYSSFTQTSPPAPPPILCRAPMGPPPTAAEASAAIRISSPPARPTSDVVHPRACLDLFTAGDFGDRRLAEDLAQRAHPVGPDPPCLVGLLADLAVEGLDDLEHGDFVGGPGEGVAPFHPPVAGQQAGPAQGREELLQELVGDAAALGELFDRHGALP